MTNEENSIGLLRSSQRPKANANYLLEITKRELNATAIREGFKNKQKKSNWNFPIRGGGVSEGSFSNWEKKIKNVALKCSETSNKQTKYFFYFFFPIGGGGWGSRPQLENSN